MNIKLGQVVKDKITGLTGTVMAICDYLTGCTHVAILPKGTKDGKIPDWYWFDIRRGEKTKQRSIEIEGVTYKLTKVTGGPQPKGPEM